MALTRNFKLTIGERVRREPAFGRHLLDEAATLFLNGEPELARVVLRDLVNATLGFESLASVTSTPAKSLHRMLAVRGNPSMDNLAAIFDAIGQALRVQINVRTVKAAQSLSALVESVDTRAGGRRLNEHLGSLPPPHYSPAPGAQGLLVRTDAAGKHTVGRFVNRVFSPVRRRSP